LSGTVLAAGEKTATPINVTVLVDGKDVAFDAYNIADNNRMKLRDVAYALRESTKKFEVLWDESTGYIYLTTGKTYTPIGGEMSPKGTAIETAIPTQSKVFLDGAEVTAKLSGFYIRGNNYYKIRDLGALLHFGVDWDQRGQTIKIDTAKDYTPEQTQPIMSDTFKTAVNDSLIMRSGEKAFAELETALESDGLMHMQMRATQDKGYWDLEWIQRVVEYLIDNGSDLGIKSDSFSYSVQSYEEIKAKNGWHTSHARNSYPTIIVELEGISTAKEKYWLEFWLGINTETTGFDAWINIVRQSYLGGTFGVDGWIEPYNISHWDLARWGWKWNIDSELAYLRKAH
jgi:hypothetical protein